MMSSTSSTSAAAIELVPQSFCVKYNPPILGILYHLTNNKEARFVHNIEINLNEEMDPKHITTHLFQTENMYLNQKFVSFNQVEKLIRKIAMNNNSMRKNLMPPPQKRPQQDDDAHKSLARQRLLKRKGLAIVNKSQEEDDSKKKEEQQQQQQHDHQVENHKADQKKNQQQQDDDFVDEDFGDFDDLPFENKDKVEQKKNVEKQQEHGQVVNKAEDPKVVGEENNNINNNINGEGQEEIEDEPSGESEQFITIHDVQYRKIQIEGDQEQYLMDPQGNIFDLNGTFIGTANSSALEQQNDQQAQANDMDQ